MPAHYAHVLKVVTPRTYIGENFLVEVSSMDVRTSRRSTETAPTVTAEQGMHLE